MIDINVIKAFGGVDMVISINGKVYGDTCAIRYDSTKIGKELELDFTLYDHKNIISGDIKNIPCYSVVEILANENANSIARVFKDVRLVGEKYCHTVDTIEAITTYVFSCKEATDFYHIDSVNEELYKNRKEEEICK